MKNNVWAKTILATYKYLDIFATSIDKLVEKQALNSFYYVSGSKIDNSVMAVSNRIIDLIERKKKLINYKVAIGQALESMEQPLAEILIERYMDNTASEDIAERHNLALRTYFRRLLRAEELFMAAMEKKGYSEERIYNDLKNEQLVMDIYRNFLLKKNAESDLELLERAAV